MFKLCILCMYVLSRRMDPSVGWGDNESPFELSLAMANSSMYVADFDCIKNFGEAPLVLDSDF